MSNAITIDVTLDARHSELEECEADGSACEVCGDAIFLSMHRIKMPVIIDGKPSSDWIALDCCQSCGPLALEELTT